MVTFFLVGRKKETVEVPVILYTAFLQVVSLLLGDWGTLVVWAAVWVVAEAVVVVGDCVVVSGMGAAVVVK